MLIYNVVPISAVQQSDSVIHTYMYIYIYTHTHTHIHCFLFHHGLPQETGYSSLCYYPVHFKINFKFIPQLTRWYDIYRKIDYGRTTKKKVNFNKRFSHFRKFWWWGMLESHQQADRREVQTGGGNGTVGTWPGASAGTWLSPRQLSCSPLPWASVFALAKRDGNGTHLTGVC